MAKKVFNIIKALDCRYEVEVNAESEKEALELADLILKSLEDTVAQHCDAAGFGQLAFFDNDSDPWLQFSHVADLYMKNREILLF